MYHINSLVRVYVYETDLVMCDVPKNYKACLLNLCLHQTSFFGLVGCFYVTFMEA